MISESDRKTGVYIFCPISGHRMDIVMCFYKECERRTDKTHKEKSKIVRRCDDFWKGIEEIKKKEESVTDIAQQVSKEVEPINKRTCRRKV